MLLNSDFYYFEYFLIKLLKKYIYKIKFVNNQIKVYVLPNSILHVLMFFRDHCFFLYKTLIDIVCSDFPSRLNRFQLNYLLLSLFNYSRINLEIYSSEFFKVNSIVSIYSNSNWYERECWDLFGVFFKKHPDLRRILTDYGFDGFPMRKDFPLSGYTEIYYDSNYDKIVFKTVEINSGNINYSIIYILGRKWIKKYYILFPIMNIIKLIN